MSMAQFGVLLIVFCTFIEGAAQVCLKKSSLDARRVRWIGIGIALFVIQGVLYTYVLQWVDISTAYPLGALSFVVVTLLSQWLLSEVVTPRRWLGVCIIVAGCVLIVT